MDDLFGAARPAQFRPGRARLADRKHLAWAGAALDAGRFVAIPRHPACGQVLRRVMQGVDRRSRQRGEQGRVRAHAVQLGNACGRTLQCRDCGGTESRQLPARDRDQPVFIEDEMIAGLLGRIDVGARGDHRPHAGPGRDDVRLAETERRELTLRGSQNVIKFRSRDRRFTIQIVAVIDVGCPDESRTFPRNRKNGSPIVGMEKGDGLRQRQSPSLEQQVAAPQRPQLRLRPYLAAQPIGPDAGRIDDAVRLDLEGLASDRVAKRHAFDAVRPPQQRFRRQIVERQSAVAPRLGEHAQDETRVVGLGVEIGPAPLQSVWRQDRRTLEQGRRVMPPPGARAAKTS